MQIPTYSFPAIDFSVLNYNPVLVLSEVYIVSWPFLINIKLRKAAVVSSPASSEGRQEEAVVDLTD